MPGLLHTVKDAVLRQMIEGQGAHFAWRGVAVPIDPFLEGLIRYGKKIGFEFPIIAPDNQFLLAEDAVFASDRVVVDRDVNWLDAGGYVTINRRELHRVEDVSENVIIMTTTLRADHPVRTAVYHYSNPVKVEGSYAAQQTIINIDVPYFLVRGDVVCVSPDTTLDISFVEYLVVDLVYVGMSGGLHQYQVVLNKPLHRSLEHEEIIQLRAYPAYVSNILKIPQAENSRIAVVGPYLVDWYSEPFLNDLDVQEYQTLQRFNDMQIAIGSPVAVEKNHLVAKIPIRSDQLLWWTKVYGTVLYRDDVKKTVAVMNDSGYWWFRHACRPYIEVPSTNARGLIVTIPKAQFLNNDWFRVFDDVDAVVFEYQVDDLYVPTASAAAVGSITVSSIPNDNDAVVLDDGFGSVVTFEFQRTAGFIASATNNRIVNVQTAVNFTDVAIALEQAINQTTTINITSVNIGPVLNMENENVSTKGNTAIVLVGVAWPTVGFAGGTDPVETIDIRTAVTSLETAQLTAAALNRSDLHIKTIYPTIAGSVQIISTVDGPDGNGAITKLVVDPGFTVQGMSGGTGGMTWNITFNPEAATTVRLRCFPNGWQTHALVAGIDTTVTLSLSPTDQPVERIDVLIKSDAGTKVLISDWGISGARVSSLQHTYVAHVFGERNFASTGLMVKPLFPSLEDLRAYHDQDMFDFGSIRL